MAFVLTKAEVKKLAGSLRRELKMFEEIGCLPEDRFDALRVRWEMLPQGVSNNLRNRAEALMNNNNSEEEEKGKEEIVISSASNDLCNQAGMLVDNSNNNNNAEEEEEGQPPPVLNPAAPGLCQGGGGGGGEEEEEEAIANPDSVADDICSQAGMLVDNSNSNNNNNNAEEEEAQPPPVLNPAAPGLCQGEGEGGGEEEEAIANPDSVADDLCSQAEMLVDNSNNNNAEEGEWEEVQPPPVLGVVHLCQGGGEDEDAIANPNSVVDDLRSLVETLVANNNNNTSEEEEAQHPVLQNPAPFVESEPAAQCAAEDEDEEEAIANPNSVADDLHSLAEMLINNSTNNNSEEEKALQNPAPFVESEPAARCPAPGGEDEDEEEAIANPNSVADDLHSLAEMLVNNSTNNNSEEEKALQNPAPFVESEPAARCAAPDGEDEDDPNSVTDDLRSLVETLVANSTNNSETPTPTKRKASSPLHPPSPKRIKSEPLTLPPLPLPPASEPSVALPPLPPPEGIPLIPNEFPVYPNAGVGVKVDERKLREVGELLEVVQSHMVPGLEVKGVSFVCTMGAIPEYSEDEASEGEDVDPEDFNRAVRFGTPEGVNADDTALIVIAADYSDFTPVPWAENIALDGVAVQHTILSVNGREVGVPENWALPTGETSRFKSFVPALVELEGDGENFFCVQRVGSAWRVCLVGVVVRLVDMQGVCERVRERGEEGLACAGGGVSGVEVSVSLRCPLTQTRIMCPARGVSCEHPDCFDLASFITMCSATHLWMCPLCQRPVPPSDLRIISAPEALLAGEVVGNDTAFIAADGTWSWLVPDENVEREYMELD